MKKNKILFFVNSYNFFITHRLPIAKKLLLKNYEVYVVSKNSKYKDILRKNKIFTYDVTIPNNFFDIFSIIKFFFQVFFLIKKIQPKIVHSITIKPILIVSLNIKLFYKKISHVLSFSGLGYVYTEKKISTKILRFFVDCTYKFVLKKKNLKIIVQNKTDFNFFRKKIRVNQNLIELINGSGVDIKYFEFKPLKKCKIRQITMISRILKHKGIYEFIESAKQIKKQYDNFEFNLIGSFDIENPSNISKHHLKKINYKKYVKFLNYKKNIKKYIYNSHIIVLPSYREGFPKVLMEAASCGRPAISTNVPGCRDAIINNFTGLLVKPKSSKALKNAILRLSSNKKKLIQMSKNTRKNAIKKFNIDLVVSKHLKIYQEINE